MEWAVGVVVLTVSLAFVWVLGFYTSKKRNQKGPPSWPLIGAVPALAANLARFHDYVTHYCRLYTTCRVPYPTFDYYYTVHPANVEHILKTNFHNYVKGSFLYDKHREFLGNGIFSVDGVEWKQQRKTASYEFASRALREFSEAAFRDKAVALAKFLLCEAQDGKQVDMQDLMLRLTFDSFSKIGFGLVMSTLQKNPPPEQLAFVHAFDESNALVFVRYVDPLWRLKRWLKVGSERRLAKAVVDLDGIIFSCIEQRRRELQQASKINARERKCSKMLLLSQESSGNGNAKNVIESGRENQALNREVSSLYFIRRV